MSGTMKPLSPTTVKLEPVRSAKQSSPLGEFLAKTMTRGFDGKKKKVYSVGLGGNLFRKGGLSVNGSINAGNSFAGKRGVNREVALNDGGKKIMSERYDGNLGGGINATYDTGSGLLGAGVNVRAKGGKLGPNAFDKYLSIQKELADNVMGRARVDGRGLGLGVDYRPNKRTRISGSANRGNDGNFGVRGNISYKYN